MAAPRESACQRHVTARFRAPVRQWRVSDTLTTTPHPYTPHCAPLVRGYLRLTARVMPPAWSPDRSGLRGGGAPLFGAACTGCRRFRSTLRVSWNDVHRVRGKRGKRWAAEMVSLVTERLSPPPIFSLPLIRRRTSFRCRRQEAGGTSNLS